MKEPTSQVHVALAALSQGDQPHPADLPLPVRPPAASTGSIAKLRDVAALAKVSPATVSLVLNNNPRITQATQQRVRRAAEQLGYRPKGQSAPDSRRGGRAIAVLLPSLTHALVDRYFGELISGIVERAQASDWKVLLEQATPEMIQARKHLELFDRRFADGVLCLGNSDRHPFLTDFAAAHHPMVVVNNYFPQWDLDHVVCDYRSGAEQAMNYLLQLGHRRIGMISGSTWVRTARDVVDVYDTQLRAAGVEPLASWREDGLYTEAGGAAAATALMRRHPELTALFAGNDKMAIGALHALGELGARVPEEVSVVGIDDMPVAFVRPPLTTVHTPLYQVGGLACEQLIARIEGRQQRVHCVVATHLVVRGSSAIAPSQHR